jgi:hypothetical protein
LLIALALCSIGCDNKSSPTGSEVLVTTADQRATRFPNGTFKAKDIVLEVKDGPTYHANEMHTFDVTATVTSEGMNAIAIETTSRLRRRPADATSEDRRIDYYRVEWKNESRGRLVNRDDSQPSGEFTLEDGQLTIRAWVARNNAWETQVYERIIE